MRGARPQDVGRLLSLAQHLIGGTLAGAPAVRKVMARRPDGLWVFYQNRRICGGIALLMLNRRGCKALLGGTLNALKPSPALLAPAPQPPAAIYVWAVAHRAASDGIVKIFAKLRLPRYAAANIYAAPATEAGRRWMQDWGFAPIPGHPRNLHQYVRWANRCQQPGR